jgi:hypothetical protein
MSDKLLPIMQGAIEYIETLTENTQLIPHPVLDKLRKEVEYLQGSPTLSIDKGVEYDIDGTRALTLYIDGTKIVFKGAQIDFFFAKMDRAYDEYFKQSDWTISQPDSAYDEYEAWANDQERLSNSI